MAGADVVEAGIAVVRYFGGTKLGTGGLARAYGGAAAEALSSTTLTQWHRIANQQLQASFADTSTLENLIVGFSLAVVHRTYTEDGTIFTVRGPEETLKEAALAEWIR